MRGFLGPFVAVLLVVVLSVPAEAWGPSTHNALANESLRTLSCRPAENGALVALIEKHLPAYHCGSDMPDVLLVLSRQTAFWCHTEAFWDACFRYAYDHFSQPWNEEQEKTIAHFCGILAHGVSDYRWHGGGGHDESCLHRCIEHDLPGNPLAEAQLEAGIDYFSQVYDLREPYPLDGWYLPTQHLLTILHDAGHTSVTEGELVLGNQAEIFAIWFQDLVQGIFFVPTRIWFPWTHAYYRDYFYGGFYDAADGAAVTIRENWEKLLTGNFTRALGAPSAGTLLQLPGAPGPWLQAPTGVKEESSSHARAGLELLQRGVIGVPYRPVAGGYEFGRPEIRKAGAFSAFLSEQMREFFQNAP
jgi:hypothetical protein